MIADIVDPFDRYIAFLRERNAIYLKKTAGLPWPWTQDPILQAYRFTEVYRERDRTSLHYQRVVRDFYGEEEAIVLPATVLYRWFNRVETCEHFFSQPDFDNASVFERYWSEGGSLSILSECLHKIPPPHITGAFIITGQPGFDKGPGVLLYFHHWFKKPWEETYGQWLDGPPTLQEMYDWLTKDARGLGSFMGAQLVADLKYLPFMKHATDWWSWAMPGPGSQRGLNIVTGRPMHQSWNVKEWQEKIQVLNKMENLALYPHNMGPFHCQDTQNHCCEFSKYEKARTGAGRPRQVYRRLETC